MDLRPLLTWSPPRQWEKLTVIDSHTGGEPFRVVVEGAPDIPGETVLERRRFAQNHLDDLRKLLMWEPRGHADMYGCLVGPPVRPDSDVAVLFMHNDGFSTMCGHGIIALTKVLLETGVLAMSKTRTTIGIDTPAGRVMATAAIEDGRVGQVRFRNVPSFVVELDASVKVPELGTVIFDLAFGGAFYAYVDADSVGISLDDASALVRVGRLIKNAIMDARSIHHPTETDLGFLYGVIFTGPAKAAPHHSRNVCVFADGEIDRSPTGTGLSGRLAIAHAREEITLEQEIVVESIVGSVFAGSAVAEVAVDSHRAIIPEITGTAHILGRSEFWVDPMDEIGRGFFIR